ncbi:MULTISPECIES: DUF1842 domain-containing protein [unclassified Bradyrhizobium]|uniref:DUF1842 domain-containing protein n=1 Tax=unclassified Bradyrhizobium TaxID=2631580 RepID=UPI0020B28980|nr:MULTISPECIES: DUF1842 domain-containing protein [unclassified Bradyrhizobium]MCP3468374.1 DUF1842 domain-containing protein [Bradyrhizobium sp. CCGUVB23]MCP3476592.1 DUF1842 domain-containing protein [Bradyrhizobium sp. CCGUVB1N3]MCP3477667.1 DUF1842 domain-containing protein [Bradyrhizobium sp. CCGUVB1N3]
MPDTTTKDHVGLFHACYQIGESRPGGRIFKLDLVVDTPNRRIQGFGSITQAVNPPLDVTTSLQGNYSQLPTLPPAPALLLVLLTGYPPIHWPTHGGLGPQILPNVDLRMTLVPNWQSGIASYRYRSGHGDWQEIEAAPVKLVSPAIA